MLLSQFSLAQFPGPTADDSTYTYQFEQEIHHTDLWLENINSDQVQSWHRVVSRPYDYLEIMSLKLKFMELMTGNNQTCPLAQESLF